MSAEGRLLRAADLADSDVFPFAQSEADAPADPADSSRPKVFDLHCDTLDRLCLSGDASVPGGFFEHDAGVPRARMSRLDSNDAALSLERMAAYRWCQCFAVYVPDVLRGAEAWDLFCRVEGFWRAEVQRCAAGDGFAGAAGALGDAASGAPASAASAAAGTIAVADDEASAQAAFARHASAGMLTVEGMSFLEDDASAAERLDGLERAGVRMATLTWNGPNALGSGNDTDQGLTAFGRSVVRELERRGIVVDASHLNQRGFRDLLEVAQAPFACSHSNARAVCDHPRNLEDWQLREVADRGGIVGLNYFNGFLREDGGDAAPDDLLRHADHMLNVAGERVLALGSDFDGSDIAPWLDSCEKVARLRELFVREFGEEVTLNVFWNNAARFFWG